jgi:RimJ/RimL family protein N-acetyltransferase
VRNLDPRGVPRFEGVHWWPTPGATDLDPEVPEPVGSAFSEGIRALSANCPRAAAVMFRGMLATVVRDKGSDAAKAAPNLHQQLKAMEQDGTLHPRAWSSGLPRFAWSATLGHISTNWHQSIELRQPTWPDCAVSSSTSSTRPQPFEWTGFRDPGARRRRWEQDGWIGRDSTHLAVALSDGTLAGIVSWRTIKAGGPEGGCLEIGALLFPEHRGRGLGSAAQRLLVGYLFATTLANRLQAITDVENLAEQRALERIGFRREGVMRGLAFIGGQWRDGVLYARLRGDTTGPGE